MRYLLRVEVRVPGVGVLFFFGPVPVPLGRPGFFFSPSGINGFRGGKAFLAAGGFLVGGKDFLITPLGRPRPFLDAGSPSASGLLSSASSSRACFLPLALLPTSTSLAFLTTSLPSRSMARAASPDVAFFLIVLPFLETTLASPSVILSATCPLGRDAPQPHETR